jgi:Major Facilitator Superfamily
MGLGFGIPAYNPIASLFLQSLVVEFGWSRSAASAGLIALPIMALILPFLGRLIDRVGVRKVAGVSAACMALCYIWLACLGSNIGGYYAAIIALNVLGAGTAPIVYTRLIVPAFVKARGTALATAQIGIAFMGILLPPFLGMFLTLGHWRQGYFLLAGLSVAGGVAAQLLMRPGDHRAALGAPRMPVSAVLRRADFWVLGFALFVISVAAMGLTAHLQPVLLERGIDRTLTTYLLSSLSISVLLSRLLCGRLLDFKRPALWAALTLVTASLGAIILLSAGHSTTLCFVAILFLGIATGAELDLMSFFCARLFGLAHYSAVYGQLGIFFFFGIAVGGIGYGAVRDATGSYALAIAMTLVLLLTAAVLFVILDRFEGARQPPDRLHPIAPPEGQTT